MIVIPTSKAMVCSIRFAKKTFSPVIRDVDFVGLASVIARSLSDYICGLKLNGRKVIR
ncbi:hypothetical protein YPSE1_06820 [Yersinia pseudotuberculosis]|nr:hypothetical protein YPSE1_06820 [Yersinia pseudotuberculosis]